MAKTDVPTSVDALPDWWEREKRRRQLRILIFLMLLLILIGFFYWQSYLGRIGTVQGINFETGNYIAFVREEDRQREGGKGLETVPTLYAIRADGNDLRQLTPSDDKSNKMEPTWTQDGAKLLYASNRGESRVTQIFLLGGGEPKQLTYGSGNKFSPIVSPGTDKRAAFVTQGAIKTVNLNGTDVYQVIPPPQAGNSPDNPDEMAAAVDPRGAFRVAAFSRDGRGIAGVQDLGAEEMSSNINSDVIPGDQVARVIPPGGSRALILDTGREVSLAWEPNGDRLATAFAERLIKDKEGKYEYVSGISFWSFENPSRPTHKPLMVSKGLSILPRHLAWSPDGSKMAFEGWHLVAEDRREQKGIIVMDTNTPGLLVTEADAAKMRYMIPTTTGGKPQRPKWSPDGSRLLFEMVRPDGKTDLWVVNSDGTNPINLTQGKGNNTQAVWSPRR